MACSWQLLRACIRVILNMSLLLLSLRKMFLTAVSVAPYCNEKGSYSIHTVKPFDTITVLYRCQCMVNGHENQLWYWRENPGDMYISISRTQLIYICKILSNNKHIPLTKLWLKLVRYRWFIIYIRIIAAFNRQFTYWLISIYLWHSFLNKNTAISYMITHM